MKTRPLNAALKLLAVATLFLGSAVPAAEADNAIFNPVLKKLKEGGQVVGGTVSVFNVDIYCAMAQSGFDYLWIEMQHSPLTFSEVATMIRACPGPAVPFIRVPTDSEGDIQKAVDTGALGVIVPMVDTLDKIQNAIKFAMYPPLGRRSQGGGLYGALWGQNYRRQANDNIMIVAMIENQAGVELVEKIAAVPEVDVVFAASSDLGSFTGLRQVDAQYEALVTRIHDATLAAGKYLAGPSAWKDTREGYTFFQGPGETQLLRSGARLSLQGSAEEGQPRGVAPIEGTEPR
jgi:2-keto-3-deoxy-L-rhamnonate aldolase RhmA